MTAFTWIIREDAYKKQGEHVHKEQIMEGKKEMVRQDILDFP